MNYLFDTYAWIEMIKGTPKGIQASKLIEDEKNTIVAMDAVFGELFSWAMRNGHDPGEAFLMVQNNAHVFETYSNIWIEGAGYKETARKKHPAFGLVDGMLLAVQNVTGATIVTGDRHFKGMKKVIVL